MRFQKIAIAIAALTIGFTWAVTIGLAPVLRGPSLISHLELKPLCTQAGKAPAKQADCDSAEQQRFKLDQYGSDRAAEANQLAASSVAAARSQAYVGILQSVTSFLTLLAAILAAYYAKDSAEHSRQRTDAELKPFMNLAVTAKRRGDALVIQAQYENVGNYPAVDCKFQVSARRLPAPDMLDPMADPAIEDYVLSRFDEHMETRGEGNGLLCAISTRIKVEREIELSQIEESSSDPIVLCATVIYRSPKWVDQRFDCTAKAFLMRISDEYTPLPMHEFRSDSIEGWPFPIHAPSLLRRNARQDNCID